MDEEDDSTNSSASSNGNDDDPPTHYAANFNRSDQSVGYNADDSCRNNINDNSSEINLNGQCSSSSSTSVPSNPHARMSFSDVRNMGPPMKHRDFPPPVIHPATREIVICYDASSEQFINQEALFRSHPSGNRNRTECAYIIGAQNCKRKTQMGTVQICNVLVRNATNGGNGRSDDDEIDSRSSRSSSSSSSSSDDSDCLDMNDEFSPYMMDSSVGQGVSTNDFNGVGNRTSGNNELIFHLTNRWVAIKVSSKELCYRKWSMGESVAENPFSEIAAAQLVGNDHENVSGIIEALQDNEYIYTIMPYYPGGDLYDFIEMNENRTEESAKHCFSQILKGLYQLQICNIFHRDLSIENVLLCGDRCVIIDYGMSLSVPVDENGARRLILPMGASGKVRYMAPEIFANRLSNRYAMDGFTCDLWSAGVILFVLLTGKFPYMQPDQNDVGFCWATNNISKMFEEWKIPISPLLKDLLEKMFQLHPMHRPTLMEVMEHPWLVHDTHPRPNPRSVVP